MNAMKRTLILKSGDRNIDVPILIFWPVEQAAAWSCRWEIQWPERKRSNTAHGYDAVQSMMNALQVVGAEIHCSEAHKAGRLSWAEKWSGYGFPVPANIRDMLTGDDKSSL